MTFKLEIRVDNAAYEEDMLEELANDLFKAARHIDGMGYIEQGDNIKGMLANVKDCNGNTVGHYGFY